MNALVPSRRAFLAGAAPAAVALALPAVVTAAEPSPLPALIEAYVRANKAFCAAVDEQDAAEARFKQTPGPMVPLSLMPDGRSASGHMEYRTFSTEAIEAEIRKTHASLRDRHCSAYVRAMAPELHAAMAEALDQSERACFAALADVEQRETALRDTTGVTEAERLWDETCEAEDKAVLAVLAYVPKTDADRRLKADWLWKFAREVNFDEDQARALASSIAGEA